MKQNGKRGFGIAKCAGALLVLVFLLLTGMARPAQAADAVIGLARIGRPQMKHKAALHGAGHGVEIAEALRMDPDLTEQICRLYLTHPGMDADGIMTKMGL